MFGRADGGRLVGEAVEVRCARPRREYAARRTGRRLDGGVCQDPHVMTAADQVRCDPERRGNRPAAVDGRQKELRTAHIPFSRRHRTAVTLDSAHLHTGAVPREPDRP